MEAAQKSRGWNVHIIGRTVISSATYSQWSQETKISMAARLGANDGIPRRWYSTSDDSFGNGLEQPSTSYLHHPHAVGNRHFWQQFSPHHPTYLMILDLWATPKQHQKGEKNGCIPILVWYYDIWCSLDLSSWRLLFCHQWRSQEVAGGGTVDSETPLMDSGRLAWWQIRSMFLFFSFFFNGIWTIWRWIS